MKEKKEITKIENSEKALSKVNQTLKLAEVLYKSGIFPTVRSPAQAVAIISMGNAIGLHPVQALQTMSVINNRICVEAKVYLALAIKHGVRYKIIKSDDTVCEIVYSREGFEDVRVVWTIERARREIKNIERRDSWREMQATMLFWRNISEGVRKIAPDAILGVYTKEEMLDTVNVIDTEVIEPRAYSKTESRYNEKEINGKETAEEQEKTENHKPVEIHQKQGDMITPAQIINIHELLRQIKIKDEAKREMLKNYYGVSSTKELTREQANDFILKLAKHIELIKASNPSEKEQDMQEKIKEE